jgi:putative endopeptidase
MNRFLCICFLFGFLGACNSPETPKRSFVDVSGIDSSIKPGDDFFRYVNGRWYDTAKIADDQTGVGSYSFLNIPQKLLLQNILDSVSKMQNTPGSIDQKVGDFYASGMDTTTINQRGYGPIQPILARIDAIADVPSLVKFAAAELKTGNPSFIGFGISPDNKNSSIDIAHVYQTGIGLPDRDYYFKTDSSTLGIQQAYKKYIATLFQLTGSNLAAATQQADVVYGIEKQIAGSRGISMQITTRQQYLRSANHNLTSVGKRYLSIWVQRPIQSTWRNLPITMS